MHSSPNQEVKRWNDALQTRLKESGGTRNVGVGMEKGQCG